MDKEMHEVILPKFGRMQEARITEWFRDIGESIAEGEPLFAIETDKASQEVEAEVSGELVDIKVAGGSEAKVGEVLAIIQVQEPGAGVAQEEMPEHDAPSKSPHQPQPARVIPMDGLRQAISARMRASLQESAQLTLSREVDATAYVREVNGDISLTAMIVQVVARALADHPLLNSSLVGEEIHVWDRRNIGVAVNIEGSGLMVPVVNQADEKDVAAIAAEIKALARKARQGEISESELSYGTFTVTNLGMLGVDQFTPILNPPEVGILGVGRIVERVRSSGGDFEARAMVTLSLTIDHRVVDGAPGAEFLAAVASRIEAADFF